jgi:hypothetical protein
VGLMRSHDCNGLALLGLCRQARHKLLDNTHAFWGQCALEDGCSGCGGIVLCSPQVSKGG